VNPRERFAEGQRLYDAGDYAGADRVLAEVEATLRGTPAVQPVLRARGLVRLRLDDPAQALRHYEEALHLVPDDSEIHYRLALYYLARGDYLRGFAEYEWRLRRPEGAPLAEAFAALPSWNGEPMVGQPLLIHAEQGLGDALQFARFLPLAAARSGAEPLYLAVHTPLISLLAASFPAITVLERGAALPPGVRQCPLLSLPQRLGVTLETLPARIPYLIVPEPIPPSAPAFPDRLKIGIVWRSKDAQGSGRERSASLEAFRLLLDGSPPIEWISLQKDLTSDERVFLVEHRIGDAGSRCDDFLAAARIVQGLDLVISVDTAMIHLAGALGKPVWGLVPKWSDWRWLLGRTESPWYPTARLFRQDREGDWSGPLAAIREQLRDKLFHGKTLT